MQRVTAEPGGGAPSPGSATRRICARISLTSSGPASRSTWSGPAPESSAGRVGCTVMGMTDAEEAPEVEQRLAQALEPGRHAKPSEGVPQDLADDEEDPTPS